MPNSGRALLIAWLGLGLASLAPGESVPSYIVDPSPNGLPQSSVIALAQARGGYLWVGTRDGLARFDGNHFEIFTEWNTAGMNNSTIVRLFADSRGGLWVGTADGSVNFLKEGRITTLDLGGTSPDGSLSAACEDGTGAVWLYLGDSRLARCRDGEVENVWALGARYSNCRALICDSAGLVWVGTDVELFNLVAGTGDDGSNLFLRTNALPGRLDGLVASRKGGYWQLAGGRVSRHQINSSELALGEYPWGHSLIMSAIEDREGNLVIGTQNSGVFRITSTGESHRVPGLSQNTALSLCEDREGNLWVGTDGGGLNRVKRNPFSLAEAGREWVVLSVSTDTNGGMWLGFNGAGATYWKDGEWEDFGEAQGLSPNFSAVLVDQAQRVWVGTRYLGSELLRNAGLFEYVGGHFRPRFLGRSVYAIHQARSGRLWVGTEEGLGYLDSESTEWRWLRREHGLTGNQITALADDASGNVWIGTARNGLNRWHDGEIVTFHQTNGLPSENITSLLVDQEGVLWVGTGNGLGRLQSNQWARFGSDDGLVSDSIGYLIDDEQGHLWIGSNLGLMRVSKKSLDEFARKKTPAISCRVYGQGDGLPTDECTRGSQPAACRTPDGRLWFPTIKGLVTVDPSRLLPNTNPPPVAIESVRLDDVEQNTNRLSTSALNELTLPASVQRLEIFYTSLNLAAPERARFRYWMENLEETWNSPTEVRRASYTRLPPGDYRFHVTACNEDGVWNPDAVVLALTVLPPFWRTWWFLTASTLCVLGAVAGAVYYISTQKLQRQLAWMRQQEALEKERSRIARDLHDQLGANLTQVALLGEMAEEDKNSPDDIEAHARQISQTARETSHALDEIVWAANPSNDTLEGLVNYACKYAQEYLALAGLRYRLEVPPQLPEAVIAPDLRHNVFLAFKESVNNVVKHAQASEVKIRLRLNGNTFTLEVEDDGRGPADAATKTGRNGLRNMRKRMEDVGGEFAFEAGAGRGSRVRLTAPLGKR